MYFLIGVVFITILFIIISRIRKYRVLDTIPGPKSLELINLFLKGSNKDIYRYMTALPERYGPIVKVWIKPFRPMILVADPKFFQQILVSKEHLDRTHMYHLLFDVGGNGLTTQPDLNQWKSDRKLFTNIFTHGSVSGFFLKLGQHSDVLEKELDSYENQVVDVYPIILQYTLRIIIEYVTQESVSKETAIQLLKATDQFFKIFGQRLFSFYKSNDALFRLSKAYAVWARSCETVNHITNNILKTHMITRKNKSGDVSKQNFMDLILDYNPKDFILDHFKTFIIAGYESTANTTSFALFAISQRPEIQQKIYQEFLSVIGNRNEITFTDLQNMPYIDAVIKETLRMYPTVPLIQRKLKSSVTIDGITIPKDVDVMFSISSLHQLQFDRPMDFDPERFSPENLNAMNPYAFAPFSLGPRDCIGKRLAMAKTKFMVLHILRRYTLHPVEHSLDVTGELLLHSTNGVPIIFKRRQQKSCDYH